MSRHLYRLSFFILLVFSVIACKSKGPILRSGELESGVYSVIVHPSSNLSQKLKSIIEGHPRVNISFIADESYQMDELVISSNHDIEINGNGATLLAKSGRVSSTLMTFVDPRNLRITNMIIDGNYENVEIEKHLIKIHTPTARTESIILDSVSIQNADNGGVMIQNINPQNKKKDYSVGADQIIIRHCKFFNVGQFAAINIRGSHKDVLVSDCVGTDPLSRLHFAMGKMFGVSAEVGLKEDCVGRVKFENCTIKNSNGGLFAQQVRELEVINFHVDSMGHNPVYYPNSNKLVGVVAFKIDDLGESNTVLIDSFKVTNTAMLPYRVFLATEESEGIGHTSGVKVKYFESDVPIRLGASGGHSISGGKIYDASINFISPNNEVYNVDFYGQLDNVGIRLLSENNLVKDCDFYDSKVINYKQAKSNIIDNCHLKKAVKISRWILFDLNDPNDPNQLTIKDCSIVENVEGMWSGGVPLQSKNIELDIINSPTLSVSSNLMNNANIRKR